MISAVARSVAYWAGGCDDEAGSAVPPRIIGHGQSWAAVALSRLAAGALTVRTKTSFGFEERSARTTCPLSEAAAEFALARLTVARVEAAKAAQRVLESVM